MHLFLPVSTLKSNHPPGRFYPASQARLSRESRPAES